MTRFILESDATDRYNEMLDEVYETVKIGNLHYDVSRVLSEMDPIAWREGFNDWLDSEGLEIGTWQQVETQESDDEEDESDNLPAVITVDGEVVDDFHPIILRTDIISPVGAHQWLIMVNGSHYVVSAVVVPFSGPETYVFPGDENGEITDFGEIVGLRGTLAHTEAINELVEYLKG